MIRKKKKTKNYDNTCILIYLILSTALIPKGPMILSARLVEGDGREVIPWRR